MRMVSKEQIEEISALNRLIFDMRRDAEPVAELPDEPAVVNERRWAAEYAASGSKGIICAIRRWFKLS